MIVERRKEFAQMIFWCAMWLCLLQMIVGCSGGKFCMSLNQISEVNETQSLKDKGK